MALTLQRKLELAGDLAKVEPMLQRLHLRKKKPRHRVRNLIAVGSVIGAAAVVVFALYCRRGCDLVAGVGTEDDEHVGSPEPEDAADGV